MALQIIVSQTKMIAAKETMIGRKWRRMSSFEHQMTHVVNELPLLTSISSPKKKHDMLPAARDGFNYRICECLPALALMTTCHTGLNGQRSVEQQDALIGPMREVSIPPAVIKMKFFAKFLVDVDQRRWHLHPRLNGKAQTMSLTRFVIGILSKNDDLHLIKRCTIECLENFSSWRINDRGTIGIAHKICQSYEVRTIELRLKNWLPRRMYPDRHSKRYVLNKKEVIKRNVLKQKNSLFRSFCCCTRIRTQTERTRISRATFTPYSKIDRLKNLSLKADLVKKCSGD